MKTINLQRAILVDLDWLEQNIASRNESNREFYKGLVFGLRELKAHSIPASKVAELCLEKGYDLSEVLLIEARTRYANNFLNSPIQIPE